MTAIYLVCLIVGLVLSLLTLFFGAFHLNASVHAHGFMSGGHPHLPGHPHAHGSGGAGGRGFRFSAANFTTLMVFLAWFGGVGALLSKIGLGPVVAFIGAVAAGVFGAWLILLFANRVLAAHDHSMKPSDYALPGMLATVTLAIREGGCGEIVYAQGGTRKSAAARSSDGSAIGNGAEVMVEHFVEGIAFVRRWHSGAGDNEPLS